MSNRHKTPEGFVYVDTANNKKELMTLIAPQEQYNHQYRYIVDVRIWELPKYNEYHVYRSIRKVSE